MKFWLSSIIKQGFFSHSELLYDPVRYQAEKYLIIIQGVSMPMGVVMFNTLPIFALRLGASVQQVGLAYALIWITDLLQYLLGPELSRRQKKQWMMIFYTGGCISFAGVFLIPLLPILQLSQLRVFTLLVVIAFYNVFTSLSLAGFSAYIQIFFPLSITGHLLGKIRAISGLTWLITALGVSSLLGNNPPMARYYIIFAFAQLCVLIRIFLTLYGLPIDPKPIKITFPKRLHALLAPLKSASMVQYSLIALLVSFLITLPIPLFPSYFDVILNVPEYLNVLILSAPYTAAIFFGSYIGYKADTISFHHLVATAMAVVGISVFGIVYLDRITGPIIVGILGLFTVMVFGIGNSIAIIILGRERFARASKGYESESLGLGNATIGVGSAAGSLLGGSLPVISQKIVGNWVYGDIFQLLAFIFLFISAAFIVISLNLKNPLERR